MAYNKLTAAATKTASGLYSEDKITDKATNGSRKGQNMAEIFAKIQQECTLGEPDKKGNRDLIYGADPENDKEGTVIGWMNPERGMGWIDDKAYDSAIKDVKITPSITIPDPSELEGPSNNGRLPAGVEDMMDQLEAESDYDYGDN